MSRLRNAYVFAGGGEGIDTDKAKAWTITRLWYEWNDPVASGPSLHDAIKRGVQVGLKMNGGAGSPQAMSAALAGKGFTSSSSPYGCAAMFDDEPVESSSTLQQLTEWRKLRPTRFTVLTVAPFQGGRISRELAAFVNADPNLLVVVQCYVDDHEGDQLYPAWAPAAIADLVAAGIDERVLRCFIAHDARIPYGWEGVIWGFDQIAATPPIPL
jgi:hypothetical protein